MYEVACEENGKCNVDQRSFKAYLSRWMAATMVRAPFTRELLMPLLQTSAMAAARSCTGGADGQQCGLQWTTGAFDGSVGVGEQMSAMEVFQSNLMDLVPGPVTADTGGISQEILPLVVVAIRRRSVSTQMISPQRIVSGLVS